MMNSQNDFDKEEISEENVSETPKKKHKVLKRVLLGILIFIVSLIIIAAIVFAVLYFRGKSVFNNDDVHISVPDDIDYVETVDPDGQTVISRGEKYEFNKDIACILIMGVDRKDLDDDRTIGTAGQADAIYLLVLNTAENTARVLTVSRDTMTDVSKYSVEGNYIGIEKMQLCLAYSYGDGKETSSQNTKQAVSRLLYGIPIHSYVTIDMETVPVLADVVGGVTVPAYDGDKKLGYDVTLTGSDALLYVRSRNRENADANNYRMEKQRHFIKAFTNKFTSMAKSNISVVFDTYSALNNDGNMVTDVSLAQLTYLATNFLSGISNFTFVNVPGEITQNGNHAEFYVDNSALYDIILDTFYVEAK